MLALLEALVPLGAATLWAGFLVFVRVGAVMALLPAFGEQTVPARVRLVLTLAFTAVVAPAVAPMMPPGLSSGPDAILAEALSGLVLGIGFRILVLALQIAGAIAAQSTALAQIVGIPGFEPQPAIGNALVIGGLALAAASGLHLRAVEAMILSYDVLPPGRFPAGSDVAVWGLAQVVRGFSLALSIAAPFAIASLLYNAALGAINRAMPQLMVAFVGAPALSFGALALLAVVAPFALTVWQGILLDQLAAPFAVPR
ncbi:MAG: flagellar biosynthetic protein FliR [Gemmobacter sp.]